MSATTTLFRELRDSTLLLHFPAVVALFIVAAAVFYFVAVPNSLKVRYNIRKILRRWLCAEAT
jgi:hypothetical protein